MKKTKTKGGVSDVLLFCKRVVTEIQKDNGLSDYRIKIIHREFCDEDSKCVLAEINIDNEYMRATVAISPHFIEMYRQGEKKELIEALCHEIWHIKMSTIDDLATSRWGNLGAVRTEIEKLTEIYGRMIYRVMDIEGKFNSFKKPNAITNNKKGK